MARLFRTPGIEVNGEELARTNAVGAFVVRMPVPSDAELGEMELGGVGVGA